MIERLAADESVENLRQALDGLLDVHQANDGKSGKAIISDKPWTRKVTAAEKVCNSIHDNLHRGSLRPAGWISTVTAAKQNTQKARQLKLGGLV